MKLIIFKILISIIVLSALVITPDAAIIAVADTSESSKDELSVGQEHIVLRARQVYEIEWTPLRDVIKWSRRGVFPAGETVKGMPYGMPLEVNYVPLVTTFSGFLDAVNDIDSRFYKSIATRTRDAPYYSLDCSALITWAWGLETRHMTGALPSVSTFAGRDIRNIQVGDALNNPGLHVVLVTEIHYDTEGEVSAIGLMELDPPQAKFTLYGQNGDLPLSNINSLYLTKGYSIIRFKGRDDVRYMHDCAVPIDNDYCIQCIDSSKDFNIPVFLDTQRDSKHADLIKFLSQYDILNKTGNEPKVTGYTCSRGMFIYLLSKYANADIESYTEPAFEDVPVDEWYAKAIAWALDMGLIENESKWFNPRQMITDNEIAYIMSNYFHLRTTSSTNSKPLLLVQG